MRTAAFVLLALVMSTPLMAQPADVDEFFKVNDVDGDDKVALDEAVTRIRAMFAELRKADEKRKAEIWKANEHLVTSRQFACADANHSFAITREEWRTYLDKFAKDSALRPQIQQTETQVRLEFHETGYDTDENGAWTREEARDLPDADFKLYDSDKDGVVAIREFIAVRGAALRKECRYSEEEFAALNDPFSLYRKVGRNWTIKNDMDFQGFKMLTYTRQEVLSLTEEEAEVQMTQLDENKKETFKHTFKMQLKAPTPREDAPPEVDSTSLPKVAEPREERIKVEAGEWDCVVTDVDTGDFKTTMWQSKRFRGLCVKMTMNGEGMKSSMELTEFNEDGAPAAAPDPFALYKKKGRAWTHKVTVKEGEAETVSYEKYEVTDVQESRATVKVTTLDKDMKETGAAEERAVLFKAATPAGTGEPKAETIKVNAGERSCTATKVVTEEGEHTTWTDTKLGGLIVKRVAAVRKTTTTTELWELKE